MESQQQPEQRQQRLGRIVQQWEAQGRLEDTDIQWLIIAAFASQSSAGQPQASEQYQPAA